MRDDIHNHPSDTAILLPNKKFGFECVGHFKSKKKMKVNHVFEVGADEKHHRHKKAFWMGDSKLKMSTIHSFKGWLQLVYLSHNTSYRWLDKYRPIRHGSAFE
jgi:hypothetical protein